MFIVSKASKFCPFLRLQHALRRGSSPLRTPHPHGRANPTPVGFFGCSRPEKHENLDFLEFFWNISKNFMSSRFYIIFVFFEKLGKILWVSILIYLFY